MHKILLISALSIFSTISLAQTTFGNHSEQYLSYGNSVAEPNSNSRSTNEAIAQRDTKQASSNTKRTRAAQDSQSRSSNLSHQNKTALVNKQPTAENDEAEDSAESIENGAAGFVRCNFFDGTFSCFDLETNQVVFALYSTQEMQKKNLQVKLENLAAGLCPNSSSVIALKEGVTFFYECGKGYSPPIKNSTENWCLKTLTKENEVMEPLVQNLCFNNARK